MIEMLKDIKKLQGRKNIMKKKFLAVLLCVCTTATLFGGCGSSNDKGNNVASTESDVSAEETVNSEKETSAENQVTVLHKTAVESYGIREGYIYEYDSKGNVIKESKFWGVISDTTENQLADEDMIESTITYKYDEQGNLIEKNDNGLYTYTYDANNNLIKECQGMDSEIVYEYDTNNNLIKKAGNFSMDVYTYNDNNVLVAEEAYWRGNTNEEFWIANRKDYDSNGNLIKEKSYSTDGLNHSYTYEYDSNGNMSMSESISYLYGGELITDGSMGTATHIEYIYDANNNVIEEKGKDYDHDSDAWEEWGKKYEYDSQGSLTATWYYNSMYPEWTMFGKCHSYEYDERGNIVVDKELDKDGNEGDVIEYTYDDENRLLTLEKKYYNSFDETWVVYEATINEYISIEIAE